MKERDKKNYKSFSTMESNWTIRKKKRKKEKKPNSLSKF